MDWRYKGAQLLSIALIKVENPVTYDDCGPAKHSQTTKKQQISIAIAVT